MEDTIPISRIVFPPAPPSRRQTSRTYQLVQDLRRNNPDLFKSILSKRRELLNPPEPSNEDQMKFRQEWLKKQGPVKTAYTPASIRDTSEATCYTKSEDDTYKMVANFDPSEDMFIVFNPATRLPDEVYTINFLKRYREDQSDSTLTAISTFILKYKEEVKSRLNRRRHREEIGKGIGDGVLSSASVRKRKREDLGESSETVVDALDNN